MTDTIRRTFAPAGPLQLRLVALPALALAVAMMLGGSGSLFPWPEILVQVLLAGLVVAWVWQDADQLRQVPRSAWIITALMLSVPLAQLVPLPPAVWHQLPGRAVERAALATVGQDTGWRPLSLTIDRTIAALLAMTAAAAMLIMTAAQDRRGRMILLATIAGVALLSVLVGAAQLSGGDGNRLRFYYPDEAFLDGFQAGHNAQADVLLVGLVMLAGVVADWAGSGRAGSGWAGSGRAGSGRATRRPRPGNPRPRPVDPRLLLGAVGGGSLLLVLGVVLTASRTGIALLPIALGAQLLILRRSSLLAPAPGRTLDKRYLALGAILLVVAVLTTIWLSRHGALARVWARFDGAGDARPQIWRDALFAMRQYWPWGAGMGSFIPVYAAAERLEMVTAHYANRAHDDYLEFLIEAGAPGIAAFALILGQLGRSGWRCWQTKTAGSSAQMIAAMASLIIIACHSLGDYPLRTMALACMSAVCAGVLLPVTRRAEPGNET